MRSRVHHHVITRVLSLFSNMAALRCVVAAILLAFFELSYGKVCENPEVVPKVYTTTDGLVLANIAFIAQFHMKCKENVQNVPLYADVKGKIVPVVKSVESNDYQVSWTEELNKAHSGDYLIRVYDEEGYGALRKHHTSQTRVSAESASRAMPAPSEQSNGVRMNKSTRPPPVADMQECVVHGCSQKTWRSRPLGAVQRMVHPQQQVCG
ncbi:hypothetical protein HPB51_003418 [Rhipicephalus microplus]|uniref:Translocon-associated protein subunit delta n=1 Tax=Rhipicephalus microplus TaxID=6941 RepID=A0A9J6DFN7_RHIMP|nr:hypothetical protein HPB51_003418 [Rhipicephalus microplus]